MKTPCWCWKSNLKIQPYICLSICSRLRPQCHYLSWRKVCLDAKCTWKKWRASCLLLESKCDDTGSGWASWEIFFRIEKLQCHSQLIPHKGERSRLGGKRRKRSCVELKDPPPTLPQSENVLVMPVYDSTTDQNYTVNVTLGSCVYWSEKFEKWISSGCRVTIFSAIFFLSNLALYSTQFR